MEMCVPGSTGEEEWLKEGEVLTKALQRAAVVWPAAVPEA